MGIWGKIIGGAAGFAIGGPLGALLGAVAGHAVDRLRGDIDPALARQTTFTIAVIALGAKMAKADGRVTDDEIQAFKQVFQIPPEEERNVARVFDLARRDARGYEPYARQVAKMFADNPAVLEDLLDALFHIAKADKIAHPAEIEFLANVARIFGFDEATFTRIRAGHLGGSDGNPYAVLGVAPSAGDDEVRAAWRALIREHHPDRLIAQGVPQEFVDVGNNKMAEINAAYDAIRKQRGSG
jgi:DnaJ like chaperone protein